MAAPGDARALVTRLEAITQRLTDLEVQVRALVTRQTVEAKEFVVKDDRGEIRARLETGHHDPSLSMLEKLAKALKVKVGELLE